MKRRAFLQGLMSTVLIRPNLFSFHPSAPRFSLLEPEREFSHQLRKPGFIQSGWKTSSKKISQIDTLIVGSGIGGLSCARILAGHEKDFLLIEAAPFFGGTSAAGSFQNNPAPMGAHYIVTPPDEAVDILKFLEEADIITGTEKGLSVYNPRLLLQNERRRERSFYQGTWSQGIGEYLKTTSYRLKKFYQFMDFLSELRGEDGRRWFSIPTHNSSKDPRALELFHLSFQEYLENADLLDSEVGYVAEYACRDDYGASIDQVSAWAGLHYFCCRPRNYEQFVISSQDGNGHLVQHLLNSFSSEQRRSQTLFCSVKQENSKWNCLLYSARGFERIQCSNLVYAGKSHALASVLSEAPKVLRSMEKPLEQAPWLVTQVLLKKVPHHLLEPLCWDNVSKTSHSVGYIYSNFFQEEVQEPVILTHFYPVLAGLNMNAAHIGSMTKEELGKLVIEDLETTNPELLPYLDQLILRRIIHGMGIPRPGFVLPSLRSIPLAENFHLANSDSFGLPLFEEAFQAGVHSAKAILRG